MKIQRSSHTCGPVAVQNALRALGKNVSERAVKAHSGTTKKDGTTQYGCQNAIERLGYTPKEFKESKEDAYWVLHKHVQDGHPVLLSVENSTHWVTAIGIIGLRVIVQDPWKAAWNVAECGVWVQDQKQMMRWWNADEEGLYYGIAVMKDSV